MQFYKAGTHSNQPTDKLKKIKDEYETKISSLTKELKNLQCAKKEHARLLRSQTQYESQIKTLKVEVSEMKRTKVIKLFPLVVVVVVVVVSRIRFAMYCNRRKVVDIFFFFAFR